MTTQPLTCGNNHAKIAVDVWQQEGRAMNEQALASLLKAYGWSYIRRLRRKGTPYIYARKRDGASIKERYITPLSRLERLTPEQVINKLQKDCPMFGAATGWFHLDRTGHPVA